MQRYLFFSLFIASVTFAAEKSEHGSKHLLMLYEEQHATLIKEKNALQNRMGVLIHEEQKILIEKKDLEGQGVVLQQKEQELLSFIALFKNVTLEKSDKKTSELEVSKKENVEDEPKLGEVREVPISDDDSLDDGSFHSNPFLSDSDEDEALSMLNKK